MTIENYLQTILGRFNFSELDVQLVLLNNGLTGSDDVTPANLPDIKMAMYKEFPMLYFSIPKRLQEGDMTVEYDKDAMLFWYNALCKELGLEDKVNPKVINASNRW